MRTLSQLIHARRSAARYHARLRAHILRVLCRGHTDSYPQNMPNLQVGGQNERPRKVFQKSAADIDYADRGLEIRRVLVYAR